MRKIGIFLISCLFLSVANCTTLSKSIPGTGAQNVKNKFDILPATTGEGCASRILILDMIQGDARGKISGSRRQVSLFTTRNDALSAAVQDAISKLPKADFLMAPVITYDTKQYIIYESTCAKVRARGVTIN